MDDFSKPPETIEEKLESIRTSIIAEKVSTSEIAELQSLAYAIADDDILLLEWAGIEEGSR